MVIAHKTFIHSIQTRKDVSRKKLKSKGDALWLYMARRTKVHAPRWIVITAATLLIVVVVVAIVSPMPCRRALLYILSLKNGKKNGGGG